MKALIIADDLTGANVSNSSLAKNGYKVGTINNTTDIKRYENYDALGLHTDSRGISAQEAYQAVQEKMEAVKDLKVGFYNKRIDSTLRGNLGSELDAILDYLPKGTIAIVVAPYPDSGKVVIGDYMLVNGVPLELTDVKNDPTAPVHSSKVSAIFEEQTKRKTAVITVETIMQGKQAITDTMCALKAGGAEIIVVDAFTNDDINVIAQATLAMNQPFVAVDPGPFTYYLVKNSDHTELPKSKQKILFTIGSASSIVISQIARLRAELAPYVAKIDAVELLYPQRREQEIARVRNLVLSHLEDNHMLLVATMVQKEDKLDLGKVSHEAGISKQQASEIISENVARIGSEIALAMGDELGGLYTSGGDITQAFLERIGTAGIQIKDEVIPLAVYGSIMGGKLDGKAIVTKGGLIGDEYTLFQCAKFLSTKIASNYYVEKG